MKKYSGKKENVKSKSAIELKYVCIQKFEKVQSIRYKTLGWKYLEMKKTENLRS